MNGERINTLNFQIINWKKGPRRPKISFYCLQKKSHSIIFKKLPKMEKHKTIPSKICCSHNRWSQCWYVGETNIHRTHYLYAARKIRILGSKLPWDEFVLRQDSHSLYCSIIIKEEGLAILKRAGEGKVKQTWEVKAAPPIVNLGYLIVKSLDWIALTGSPGIWYTPK